MLLRNGKGSKIILIKLMISSIPIVLFVIVASLAWIARLIRNYVPILEGLAFLPRLAIALASC